MVLGMGRRFSETTANELCAPPIGRHRYRGHYCGRYRGCHLENDAFPEGISLKNISHDIYHTL